MGKYEELQAQFDRFYEQAMLARRSEDYYNLVLNLRKAAQAQLEMTDLCVLEKKGLHFTRHKELLATADQWEKLHPEAFENTNQSSSGKKVESKFVKSEKPDTTFNDVVGCEDIKAFVKKQYIKRFDEKYKAVFSDGRGGALERGMLLYGLPGTGKTLIARAIAHEVNAHFISVNASDLKDRFYGETEKKIRALYDEASKKDLSIIFIDEIETLLPSRSSDVQNHESSAVTEFLTVLDGFNKEKMSKVITIGASNYPGRIDPAALRSGRLGAWFRVDVPDAELRRKLIESNFSGGYTFDGRSKEVLVSKTKGFSSADVVSLCDRVKSELADEGINAVDCGMSHSEVSRICSEINSRVIEKALGNTVSSISRVSIEEIAKFEINYNYEKGRGIVEFMRNLT